RLARPDLDRPGPVLERRLGLRLRRVAVEPARDLRVGEEEGRRARGGEASRVRDRRERRLDEVAEAVVDGRGRRRGGGGGGRGERERAEGGEREQAWPSHRDP